jgi:FAD:protein FMN transferase
MLSVTLARLAMATRFELVLHGDDPTALRAAGEEALDEIARLEDRLSLYRPGSEIAQVNARASREAVRVSPEVFALLQQAAALSAETGGAFDITIAPLVRCWGFMGDAQSRQATAMDGAPPAWTLESGRVPSDDELVAARAVVGMNHVQLDPRDFSVRFDRDGVMLDFGAIGKGYAVERAATFLRDAGVASALLHGGTSTVCAIGAPPDADCWRIAVNIPPELERRSPNRPAAIPLKDESLSVSAVWGRSFEAGGKTFGHVIDPRTGQPVSGVLLAAVVLPSTTETDALSTALLTLGAEGFNVVSALRPQIKTLLVSGNEHEHHLHQHGFDFLSKRELAVEKQTVRG